MNKEQRNAYQREYRRTHPLTKQQKEMQKIYTANFRKRHPEIVKKLLLNYRKNHPDKIKNIHDRYYEQVEPDINTNKSRWTEDEIIMIMHFDGNTYTDVELAKKLGRSIHAIENKRYYLSRGER